MVIKRAWILDADWLSTPALSWFPASSGYSETHCFWVWSKRAYFILTLQYTFRSEIFFKFGFLGQSSGWRIISNFWKKNLKKTKYWRRNGGFTFSPEVKVYLLIDSPIARMQSTETIFVGITCTDVTNWLLSWSALLLAEVIFRRREATAGDTSVFAGYSSVRLLFRLPHFARTASRKTELQKSYLSAFGALSALRNTRVFGRFARKFHQEVNGSKLSLHWLAQLSENPVEGVCGRSLFAKQKIFLSAVFSNKFFRF